MSSLAGTPPARPAIITWPDPGAAAKPVSCTCPNCGSESPKTLVLLADAKPLDEPEITLRLLKCEGCAACFYETSRPMDYHRQRALTPGRIALYLQQGAGLRQLCRPVFKILKPPASSYLDVGCGFGFGLDFAQTAKGWTAEGLDPGPYAQLGCSLLGLAIAPSMLGPETCLQGRFDVVVSAETIEHVPSPFTFLQNLAQALKPDGVLALTTPDAGAISPALAPVRLAGLLSPVQHVVLQSQQSLEYLLKRVGFSHIRIDRDGISLLAYASHAPLALDDDEPRFSASFQHYLERRATGSSLPRDLAIGFAGRAVLEAANAGDFAAVERLRPFIAEICARHFSLNVQDISAIPATLSNLSLEDMAGTLPLNLAGILYGFAMSDLAAGQSRSAVAGQFSMVAALASCLQHAANDLGLSDGLSEDLAWVGTAEALLCHAETPPPDFIASVLTLPATPGGQGDIRRQHVIERIFITLVNAAHFPAAAALRQLSQIGQTGAALSFAHAMVDLKAAHNPAQAAHRFAKAAAQAGDDAALRANALQGEAEAKSLCEASALVKG